MSELTHGEFDIRPEGSGCVPPGAFERSRTAFLEENVKSLTAELARVTQERDEARNEIYEERKKAEKYWKEAREADNARVLVDKDRDALREALRQRIEHEAKCAVHEYKTMDEHNAAVERVERVTRDALTWAGGGEHGDVSALQTGD